MAITHHDDLELFAGDDWSIVGVLLDVNGSALDLTEATLEWTLIDPTGAQVANVQGSVSITVMAPPTNGQVTIRVPAVNTEPLTAGRYHDALRVSLGNRASLYWIGSLLVSSDPFTLIPPFQPSLITIALSATPLLTAPIAMDQPT